MHPTTILSSLSLVSLFTSALARPAPQITSPDAEPGIARTLPIANNPQLPSAVDLKTDEEANANPSPTTTETPIAIIDTGYPPVPETDNLVEVLFCITEFIVGGAGRQGFLITHHDGTANRNETVAFQNDGPEIYLTYELLKSHTNPSGFWEDVNIFGSTKGLNVGYHPTGKQLNVAGWTPTVSYDKNHMFEKVAVACRDQFGIAADGYTGSFYNLYASPVGGVIPGLLVADAVAEVPVETF